MESRALKRWSTLLAVVTILGGGAGWWLHRAPGPAGGSGLGRGPVVPTGVRIRVEVLNASTVRGLARRATLHLRDLGFDVVRFAGDDSRRDSTLVLDRTGHPEWARIAAAAMGNARVEARPDSAGFVDLTVLVGRTWRAPAQPFYP